MREGLRGEESIAVLCRREGIPPNLYYRWSKDFLEAGKKRLQGDIVRDATSSEVTALRQENEQLKQTGTEQLEASKQDYDAMIERMTLADEVYNPLISSLNDQLTFMSRDLSPAGLGALSGVAGELNGTAEGLFARVDAVLGEAVEAEAALAEQSE